MCFLRFQRIFQMPFCTNTNTISSYSTKTIDKLVSTEIETSMGSKASYLFWHGSTSLSVNRESSLLSTLLISLNRVHRHCRLCMDNAFPLTFSIGAPLPLASLVVYFHCSMNCWNSASNFWETRLKKIKCPNFTNMVCRLPFSSTRMLWINLARALYIRSVYHGCFKRQFATLVSLKPFQKFDCQIVWLKPFQLWVTKY